MLRKAVSIAILVAFISTSVQLPAFAQITSDQMPWMPKPGARIALSSDFIPAELKGITIHPENPLMFDFIIYRGDKVLSSRQKPQEYKKLIKYFLASLAIPDEDQWVNLSPYEKNRIIKDDFGKTLMGRDLLAQDYILKQLTASLIYPEGGLGKKFWDKVYAKAQQQYGTTSIPVNTFNKVWIMPDNALIYEKGNTAYVLKNHLKVMLEEDYLALKKHSGVKYTIGSQVVREIVLPALEKEVNEGKNFALLRQVYSGMLLAAWFKRTLKQSILGQIYADKTKIRGVDQDPKNNEAIYQRYLQAYKKGVFNYIKEDVNKYTNEALPRKYFSGGAEAYLDFARTVHFASSQAGDSAMGAEAKFDDDAQAALYKAKTSNDAAMSVIPEEEKAGEEYYIRFNLMAMRDMTIKNRYGAHVEFLRERMNELLDDVQGFLSDIGTAKALRIRYVLSQMWDFVKHDPKHFGEGHSWDNLWSTLADMEKEIPKAALSVENKNIIRSFMADIKAKSSTVSQAHSIIQKIDYDEGSEVISHGQVPIEVLPSNFDVQTSSGTISAQEAKVLVGSGKAVLFEVYVRGEYAFFLMEGLSGNAAMTVITREKAQESRSIRIKLKDMRDLVERRSNAKLFKEDMEYYLNKISGSLLNIGTAQALKVRDSLLQRWDSVKDNDPRQFGERGAWEIWQGMLPDMEKEMPKPSSLSEEDKHGLQNLMMDIKANAVTVSGAEKITEGTLYDESKPGIISGGQVSIDMLPLNFDVQTLSGPISAQEAIALVKSGKAVLFDAGNDHADMFFLIEGLTQDAAMIISPDAVDRVVQLPINSKLFDVQLEKLNSLKRKFLEGDLSVIDQVNPPLEIKSNPEAAWGLIALWVTAKYDLNAGSFDSILGYLIKRGSRWFSPEDSARMVDGTFPVSILSTMSEGGKGLQFVQALEDAKIIEEMKGGRSARVICPLDESHRIIVERIAEEFLTKGLLNYLWPFLEQAAKTVQFRKVDGDELSVRAKEQLLDDIEALVELFHAFEGISMKRKVYSIVPFAFSKKYYTDKINATTAFLRTPVKGQVSDKAMVNLTPWDNLPILNNTHVAVDGETYSLFEILKLRMFLLNLIATAYRSQDRSFLEFLNTLSKSNSDLRIVSKSVLLTLKINGYISENSDIFPAHYRKFFNLGLERSGGAYYFKEFDLFISGIGRIPMDKFVHEVGILEKLSKEEPALFKKLVEFAFFSAPLSVKARNEIGIGEDDLDQDGDLDYLIQVMLNLIVRVSFKTKEEEAASVKTVWEYQDRYRVLMADLDSAKDKKRYDELMDQIITMTHSREYVLISKIEEPITVDAAMKVETGLSNNSTFWNDLVKKGEIHWFGWNEVSYMPAVVHVHDFDLVGGQKVFDWLKSQKQVFEETPDGGLQFESISSTFEANLENQFPQSTKKVTILTRGPAPILEILKRALAVERIPQEITQIERLRDGYVGIAKMHDYWANNSHGGLIAPNHLFEPFKDETGKIIRKQMVIAQDEKGNPYVLTMGGVLRKYDIHGALEQTWHLWDRAGDKPFWLPDFTVHHGKMYFLYGDRVGVCDLSTGSLRSFGPAFSNYPSDVSLWTKIISFDRSHMKITLVSNDASIDRLGSDMLRVLDIKTGSFGPVVIISLKDREKRHNIMKYFHMTDFKRLSQQYFFSRDTERIIDVFSIENKEYKGSILLPESGLRSMTVDNEGNLILGYRDGYYVIPHDKISNIIVPADSPITVDAAMNAKLPTRRAVLAGALAAFASVSGVAEAKVGAYHPPVHLTFKDGQPIAEQDTYVLETTSLDFQKKIRTRVRVQKIERVRGFDDLYEIILEDIPDNSPEVKKKESSSILYVAPEWQSFPGVLLQDDKDNAQLSNDPGGIDMNAANLNLMIKRDGAGMVLPLAQQDMVQLENIEGLDPVILSIKPFSMASVEKKLILR